MGTVLYAKQGRKRNKKLPGRNITQLKLKRQIEI